MSAQISLPLAGYAGWAFLKRTQAQQMATLAKAPDQVRAEAYFREKIGGIDTAEQLVADRRLLSVALGAFGLSDDINNRYFLRKVLESDTLLGDSLANKLSDKRYADLANAFGFGTFTTPRNKLSDFADKIIAQYRQQGFETAVGDQSASMRIALYAERELPDLAQSLDSDTTKWFKVIGSEPLRNMFQTLFALPSSFGALDIDQQVATLRKRSKALLGSSDLSQFTKPEVLEKTVRRYLLQAQIAEGTNGTSPASAALQLLQARQGNLSLRL